MLACDQKSVQMDCHCSNVRRTAGFSQRAGRRPVRVAAKIVWFATNSKWRVGTAELRLN
jgi:hypothetical protein